MGKYIVIGFPLVLLVFNLCLGGYYVWQALASLDFDTMFSTSLATQSVIQPIVADEVYLAIDEFRWRENLPSFDRNEEFCSAVFSGEEDLHTSLVMERVCENCTQAGIIKILNVMPVDLFITSLQADPDTASVISSVSLTHLCAQDYDDHVSLFFARVSDFPENAQSSESLPVEDQVVKQKELLPATKNFSEDELWEALMSYRDSHGVRRLERNEKVCEYARKRVQDHISDFTVREKADYPVQEKYPLDAHEGFSEDAESGYVFEVTGMHKVAENLAYWPEALYPTHVIEWGWDTSTEGHREAQLSQEYGWGCLAGEDGFFVAIFAD